MLVALLKLNSPSRPLSLEADIWNVSSLAAASNYDFVFEQREKTFAGAQLEAYPRWCESTRGLVARCLGYTADNIHRHLPEDWQRLEVQIGIRPGGRGLLRPLSLVTVSRNEERGLDIGWAEQTGQTGFLSSVEGRELYTDAWSLAEHALRMSAFGADVLPAAKALDIPVRRTDSGLTFVCTSDLPEPTRSVFEQRMAHSTRPVVPGHFDAVYSWDWTDFLNGQR